MFKIFLDSIESINAFLNNVRLLQQITAVLSTAIENINVFIHMIG